MLNTNRPIARKIAATSRWLSVCWLLAVTCTGFAQTLARPGWTASGFSADPWWKHAVFYEIKVISGFVAYVAGDAPPSAMDWVNDPKTISARLEALHSLGVDGLIVPMPVDQSPQAVPDNFDALMREASQSGVHILLSVPTSAESGDLAGRAELWLSRGISGFYVSTPAQGDSRASETVVAMLRKIASTAVGGRIVIADLPSGTGGGSGSAAWQHRVHSGSGAAFQGHNTDATGAQLLVDAWDSLPSVPDAASLRRVVEAEPADTTVLVDLQQSAVSSNLTEPYAPLWKAIAAISLTTHPVALIDADIQLSGSTDVASTTLVDWYRQLIALHRGNATLRYGSATALNLDAQNALVWVSRASAGTGLVAPVVVACNLSSTPIRLSLGSAMRGLNLHGSFLRTLLRTDSGMGPQDLDAVTVPGYGVYIGELHR